jgi:uncharacterized Zn finger protein
MIRKFLVQGSASEPYEVVFRRNGSNLSAYCTCQAGTKGNHCKHRFAILRGSEKGIVSGNESQVAEVAGWLPGTDVEAAMAQVEALEDQANQIKKALSEAKKDLAKAMRN